MPIFYVLMTMLGFIIISYFKKLNLLRRVGSKSEKNSINRCRQCSVWVGNNQ